jgi:hypothetical protein
MRGDVDIGAGDQENCSRADRVVPRSHNVIVRDRPA